MHSERKKVKIKWLLAAIISILIGLVTNVLMGGSLNMSIASFLWNAGYSLSLGLPLFANGVLFHWYEKDLSIGLIIR